MSAWFGVSHPGSQGIRPGIGGRRCKSRAHGEDALVSGPTGTWPLIDQELQTDGLAPKIKTAWVLSDHLPPPCHSPIITHPKQSSVCPRAREAAKTG